ncbi:MAG TPA: prepilin-type N-terminal cleavage/methylation domain-containing protein [Fibrobacteraceae bacterium]|nr:prepilin-type N-terminal cleavage/methylation domain-containing protein [Fibrobacteraceae bacterium]
MLFPNRKGFTLIELLVATTIASLACTMAVSLWFGLHQTVLRRETRNLENLATQTGLLALQGRMQRVESLLELGSDRLLWQTDNHQDTLDWSSDSLLLNGHSLFPSPLENVEVQLLGPRWDEDSLESYADWDSLDLNNDQQLDQDEMDLDFSRSWDRQELQRASMISIHLTFSDGATALIQQALR